MQDCSVLMCVYGNDNAQYFAQAMDSILNQTVQPEEIVLVIDGPLTGDLAQTVEEYIARFPQIKPVRMPENVGTGQALSIALPLVKNEIIIRHDSDDISVPDRIEKQLAYLAQHPEVAVVSAAVAEFIDTPDNVVTIKRVPLEHAEIVKLAKRWNPINQPVAAMRKSAALAVGGYEHFPRHEDYHLWIKMFAGGYRAANLPEPLLAYRLSPANLNRRRNRNAAISATHFHLWKRKNGFATWFDTIWMIALMWAIRFIPGPIYRWIYRAKRKHR